MRRTTRMTSRKAVVVVSEGLTFGVTSKTITKSAHGACFQRRDSVYEPRYAADNKCATIKRLRYRYCRVRSRISVSACVFTRERDRRRAKKAGEAENQRRAPLMERMDCEKWEDREYAWKPPPDGSDLQGFRFVQKIGLVFKRRASSGSLYGFLFHT